MDWRLRYTDRAGATTTRMVRVASHGPSGIRCSTVRGVRTFSYTGIAEAIDMDTGEILTGAELAARLRRLSEAKQGSAA